MGGRDVPIISAFPMGYADQVRGVSRNVKPSPGRLRQFAPKLVLGFSGCSISNFSKSVYSVGPVLFFPLFSCMCLSVGGVILPNKGVTPERGINNPWCHGIRKFRKLKT